MFNGVFSFHPLLFKIFLTSIDFVILLSNPRYAYSNGEAKRAVQTIKNRSKKLHESYLALLAY